MATQFVNKATGDVIVNGQTVNFTSNTVTAELFDVNSITLVKSQLPDLVTSGGKISYTITITNTSLYEVDNFNFLDTIPDGMTYATGTFKVGDQVQTPTVTGQDIGYTFDKLPVGITIVTFECDVI